MKAIVCTEYGSPDLLQLKGVKRPTPKVDEALVRVHSSSLNASDLETLRGEFVVRMTAPRKPKHKILGSDIAGRIEAVGRNIQQFQPGDEVRESYPFRLASALLPNTYVFLKVL